MADDQTPMTTLICPFGPEAIARAGGLIGEGLQRLKALGAAGCVLLGDPAYYSRFGFVADPKLTLDGVPPEYFMRVAFSPVYGEGTVSYHPGFYG